MSVSILIILATGWNNALQTYGARHRIVSILIILATGWNIKFLVLGWNCCLFQSSSYWRLAGIKDVGRWWIVDYWCFNPHHTGDWLESKRRKSITWFNNEVSILIILATGWNGRFFFAQTKSAIKFQSSSYWRLAGIQVQNGLRSLLKMFQSSSYWRLAGINIPRIDTKQKEFAVSILIILATGWNPRIKIIHCKNTNLFQSSSYWRLAGMGDVTGSALQLVTVSILIILATGWNVRSLFLLKSASSFNPHHTGDWLEFKSYLLQWSKVTVSILIILATGWNYRKRCIQWVMRSFNPHHTGDWLE